MSEGKFKLKFADGIWAEKPSAKAPDAIKLKLSFETEKFIEFLKNNKNSQGKVNIDLRQSEKGTLFFSLNDFEPKKPKEDDLGL